MKARAWDTASVRPGKAPGLGRTAAARLPPARRSAPGIRTAARQCRASSPCSSMPDEPPQAIHGLLSAYPGRNAASAIRCRCLYQRSEEHTSELQSLMRNSYAVFCLKKKTYPTTVDMLTIVIYHNNHT